MIQFDGIGSGGTPPGMRPQAVRAPDLFETEV